MKICCYCKYLVYACCINFLSVFNKSQTLEEPQPGCSNDSTLSLAVQDLLQIPKAKEKKAGKKCQPRKVKKGQVYVPSPQSKPTRTTPAMTSQKNIDSNTCGSCKATFERDVKLKNGKEWIECQFCKTWYHVECQNVSNHCFFLCSNCELSD